ncbi:UPF0449 protein C19orf25 homolog isoform X2 [Haliotis rufescens]|uniref:UPF0449 protein C19orf25 homolog isoform X2 n=1 Tax=Haliotis rufescens TaxID=6454 RepID=UPI001EAFE1B8|nr:UPF0449 protein C19orf25 homolog isoform X2 [Haliotis rufescens]
MKMSGTSRLTERPKPPTVDQIMTDIKSSKDDDPVFTFGVTGISRDTSFDMGSHSEKLMESGDHSGKSPEMLDIGTTYLKTLQLLNTTELLKSSSENLKDQFEQLEKLGTEVTEAIAELKSAAKTVKTKS